MDRGTLDGFLLAIAEICHSNFVPRFHRDNIPRKILPITQSLIFIALGNFDQDYNNFFSNHCVEQPYRYLSRNRIKKCKVSCISAAFFFERKIMCMFSSSEKQEEKKIP